MKKIILKGIENKNKVGGGNIEMKDLQIEIPHHKKAKTQGRSLILDQVPAQVHLLLLQVLVLTALKNDQDRKNQKARSYMKIT